MKVYQIENISLFESKQNLVINGSDCVECDYFSQDFYTYAGVITKIETVENKQSVVNYHTETGETLSVLDYISERNGRAELQDEDGYWPTVDDEYAYKKFVATWNPEYETNTIRTDVPFEVIILDYKEKDLPPYTNPLRLAGAKVGTTNFALFQYSPKVFELCKEIGAKYGFTYVGESGKAEGHYWTIPSHSIKDLRFIKVNEAYANYEIIELKYCNAGTIKECKAIHDANVANLEKFWKEELAKLNKIQINVLTAVNVLGKVRAIKTKMHALDVKNKSYNDWSNLQETCTKLIQELEAVVQSETKA